MIQATIRQCEDCQYTGLIMSIPPEEERRCSQCLGLMRIIGGEE